MKFNNLSFRDVIFLKDEKNDNLDIGNTDGLNIYGVALRPNLIYEKYD